MLNIWGAFVLRSACRRAASYRRQTQSEEQKELELSRGPCVSAPWGKAAVNKQTQGTAIAAIRHLGNSGLSLPSLGIGVVSHVAMGARHTAYAYQKPAVFSSANDKVEYDCDGLFHIKILALSNRHASTQWF
jgi:hypothetical protein